MRVWPARRLLALVLPFVLAGALVVADDDAGSAVVGAVPRLRPALVVWGRMLVSISVANWAEPSCAVPASLLSGDESLIRAAPSARQKASESSVSTRLHVGQRFIHVANERVTVI